jgi:hypothetical protein
MGYNRGGTRRTARLKRRKRLETRLAQRAAAEQASAKEGLTGKVKEMAKSAVEKVGGALHAAVEKVKDVVKK